VKKVSEAGATYVGACALRLRATARQRYLPFIMKEFPHLEERYRNTYANDSNAGAKYREGLSRFFHQLSAKYHVASWARVDDTDDEGDEALSAEHSVPSLQLTLPFPD
jgi:hypothetical protein